MSGQTLVTEQSRQEKDDTPQHNMDRANLLLKSNSVA